MDFYNTVQFIFYDNDPKLNLNKKEQLAQTLLGQLRQRRDVEKADRVELSTTTTGSKPGIVTLPGVLKTEINAKNIRSFLGFLGDRLRGKSITITVKVQDQEVTIIANSSQEVMELEKISQRLLNSLRGNKEDV